MEVVFKCPHCKSTIEADSEMTGVRAQCPACEEVVLVPAPGVSIGMTIGGFQIEKRLGVGGMGEVFAAKQVAMDRQVALKILPPALTDDKRQVDRFLQEVRMAAKLEHTNIVTAFDAGQADGFYYLAMSFVEGEDLDRKLKREKRLQEAEALEVVIKIAGALEYAWTRHHLLHRDIKPANIMIDSGGEVKLMDMGIAKSLEEDSNLTMQGTLVGTPYYMSPEQATAAKDIDCRSDIYSLGATLYHLVTGKRPFDGPNAMAVIAKHISDTPQPAGELNAGLTKATCKLIERMMARNRDDRFLDWGELQREVIRIMSGAPTLADAIPPAAFAAAASTAATIESPPPIDGTETKQKLGITVNDNLDLKPRDVLEPTLAQAPTEIAPPLAPAPSGPTGGGVLEGGPAADDVKGLKSGIFVAAGAGMLVILVLVAVIFYIGSDVGKSNEELNVKKREQAIRDKEIDLDITKHLDKHDRRHDEKAEDMLRRAHLFADEFPNEIDKIKERFGKVVGFAKEQNLPDYELRAEDELREVLAKLKEEKEKAKQVAADAEEVMRELQNRARVLSKEYQFIPAAQVFDGYKGPLADETEKDRNSCAKLYYDRAKQVKPLEDLLRKALHLLVQGRASEVDALMRHARESGKLNMEDPIVKANLLHLFLVSRGQAPRRRGFHRPERETAKGPFLKAFNLYKEGRTDLAMTELGKMKNVLLAQIIRGEIRLKQAQGKWKSLDFSGPGYKGKIKSITLDLHGTDVAVTADGDSYFKGNAWCLGSWFYMQSGSSIKCWRFEAATSKRVILVPAEGVRMTMGR